jgi:hypothetical protein
VYVKHAGDCSIRVMAQPTQEISPFELREQQEAKTVRDDAARLHHDSQVDDLKFVMGNKQGRRFVHRLLQECGVFRSVFHTEPVVMAFNEGGRNMGLKLFAEIHEHCPARYAEMIKEHKEHGRRSNNAGDRKP